MIEPDPAELLPMIAPRSGGMARIALVAQGGTQWMGGELYIRNLFTALLRFRQRQPDEARYELAVIHANPAAFVQRHAVFQQADALIRSPKLDRGLVGKPALFARLASSGFRFAYPCHPFMPPWPGLGRCGWIPDFQHEHYPGFFSASGLRRRRMEAAIIARLMPHVVLSSQHARSDFQRLFPASRARTHVLPFHSFPDLSLWDGDPEQTLARYALPRRFLLCSGQFWAHKNHLLLLDALAAVCREIPEVFVVFTGHPYDPRNPSHLDALLARIHRLGLARHTALLGLIPREDQLQLMRACVAVLQPSLFEGWSTVVEDARALGRPMVLSDIPVHLEQAVEDGHFFEAESSEALEHQIQRVWQDHQAGPSRSREARARDQAADRADGMARTFLAIMRQSVGSR